MATVGQTVSAGLWTDLITTVATADTEYLVQNIGTTELRLFEKASAPTSDDYFDAVVLPVNWSMTLERTSSTRWYAQAAHGGGRLSVNTVG